MKLKKSLLNTFLVLGLVGTVSSVKATNPTYMDVLSHSDSYGWVLGTSQGYSTFGIVDVTNNANVPVYCIDYGRSYLTDGHGSVRYQASSGWVNEGVSCIVLDYAASHNYQLPTVSKDINVATASNFSIEGFADLQATIWKNLTDADLEKATTRTCSPKIVEGATPTALSLTQPTKFEYNKDLGEYVSQKITVTHTGDYTISLTGANAGSYVSNSATSKDPLTTTNANDLYVHIKAQETDSVSAKVEISQTYKNHTNEYSMTCSIYRVSGWADGTAMSETEASEWQRMARCELTNNPKDKVVKASINLSYNPEAPEPSKVVIKKTDATTGKELEGATLRILDKDKKEIPCTIRKSDGKEQTLEKCTWVSGKSSTTVVGLDAGDYYLEETIAPKGYVKSSKMVPFKVKADGSTTPVEMENKVEEVVVPDTLGKRSALLLTIAMFDIALGIGVLTYVKKNKVQE
ncbi:MAG: prealbumin-like fold domain-containing protein [bacterium]|nr:prealbumin-like fold domain-containing protein [bacterium]